MSNNGTMSSFTRQQRIREMEAEEVNDDARETMIVASVSAEDSSWQVQSFVDENTAYVVEVTDRLIMKCTCFDFERRQKPCKHMYLLKMHTAFSLHFSTTPLNSTYEHNVIPIPQPITTNNCSSLFFDQCIQTNQTLHQSHQDLATLAQYTTDNEAKHIYDIQQQLLRSIQFLKDKYETFKSYEYRVINAAIYYSARSKKYEESGIRTHASEEITALT
ncbi:hypothetical protein PHYBLDRAFT_146412 [Phycomyces blakesleeanus NRRL 1555(-)]|uniref:SWIM-type domain-containing protein n=1 Tax=Phycomyces blakesleeanus (strain ATCC 8743b / DSM 1359 / FGSC 10004 / NBRC 33097 / NRRL 1555) TaxID=763407 RepID=A0A167MKE9_PHYB8|nr:hypothetical protein PHYBLDRAFT_146412 [Phycomyces blakesleeanus NRRL 1555(-)]OAD73099.1 hypothetical protein PHYBLDRAFT_146412 [Phycomyces blakesleeanus NRRL 1555(-)]|eukprot:XP_018291139.1 hypothetical protein PHYBLDRAFT_146412 [Phycomyces blakesleeanus NRRL 1555(-)]